MNESKSQDEQPTTGVALFRQVSVGSALPVLDKGIMSSAHIMRWSAATENWHRIHYDETFAREVDALPDVLVNGSWKQQVLCQYIKDLVAPVGWLWKIRFRFTDMDVKNSRISIHGTVLDKLEFENRGYLHCGLQILRDREVVTTTGAAVAVFPLADGEQTPYPFTPADPPIEW